jgi:hypothetical protein
MLFSVNRSCALALVATVILVTACSSGPSNPKVPAGAKSSGGKHAVIETDKGPITIEFLAEQQPKAVENFRLLAEHGYYDGLTFHRIVKGFMVYRRRPAEGCVNRVQVAGQYGSARCLT